LCAEIFEIIGRLNREQGLTILLVEQNANAALRVSQRGYVMEVGGMVMDGPSDHLLESEDIKEFYLGKKEEGVVRVTTCSKVMTSRSSTSARRKRACAGGAAGKRGRRGDE
jgi:ABC-type cobalamin/Fe3+-siderophores transport system ATPase subunit